MIAAAGRWDRSSILLSEWRREHRASRPAAPRSAAGLSVDRVTGTLVDGLGAAAATSGILTQQQARIFGLLYLAAHPLSLDEIAEELSQSKSNVSLNMRVLVEWHLVRRRPVPGSRKDHYEAATDFFRAMQEIFERRFRWTVRQVLTAVADARAAAGGAASRARRGRARGGLGAASGAVSRPSSG